jgi:hypothetical protein
MRGDMNARLATLTPLLVVIIAVFVAIVIMAIGFALWDRRTMLRPVEQRVRSGEDNRRVSPKVR